MKVLVLAPHPDDEAIGCGGAILDHADRGDTVDVVFVTSGELGLGHLPPEEARAIREEEARTAARALGVRRLNFLRQPDWTSGEHLETTVPLLTALIAERRPDLLYAPHAAEWHPDHQAGHLLALRALAAAGHDAPLLQYEVWTPLTEFDTVRDITRVMRRKLDAIGCYPSQLVQFDYSQAVRGLGSYRGALAARSEFAEVFLGAEAAA